MNQLVNDPIGMALTDCLAGDQNATLQVETTATEPEELSASYFFRSYDEMPEVEKKALELTRGRVLDIGAGGGCHSLVLQKWGFAVDAIDISGKSVEVMQQRGVKNATTQNLYSLKEQKYDTLLMLMNGAGVAGTLPGLEGMLKQLKSLLTPGGQILVDSSDLIYLFAQEDGSFLVDLAGNYYGEVTYKVSYKGLTAEFPWLFVDFYTLETLARKQGLVAKMVIEDDHYLYLAQLTLGE